MSERTPDGKSDKQLDDDELSSGLNAAFGTEAHADSILRALDARPVHLPGSEPVPAGDTMGRYQLVGEIARGGMGVIYKGRDVDLGRDVAMKVLRASYKDNAEASERFLEEAQVGGQLQHPGIVPVYELGMDGDDQPYFSMKLVKGETLAALLKERETDRRRLLTIFEQVCQTMAYAHARGVIHRDLKPANIMVGAFGEVQVVDWGFAKVLGQGGIADERPRPDVSVIATVRSSGEGSDSVAGSVMGTPAYMPPEQAFGHVEALDERSDVFALGAILYEVLTGRPLYDKDGDNLLVQAARCDLAQALDRLKNEELEPLLRECLAASQSARPKNAGLVAEAIAAHLEAVDDRARAAEVAEAEAQVHAEGERRKRRLTLVLGAALLAVVVVAGLTWHWIESRDRARVATLRGEARQAHEKAVRLLAEGEYGKAEAEVKRSLDLARTPAAAALEGQIRNERDIRQRDAAQRARDRVLLTTLTRIRSSFAGTVPDEKEAQAWDARLRAAFDAYGTSPAEVDGLLEPDAELRVSIAAALTDRAALRRGALRLGSDAWGPLLAAASGIDRDELRVRYREAFRERAHGELKEMAAALVARAQPPATIDLLAMLLLHAGARDEAVDLLTRGQFAHPGDYFINLHLGVLHPDSDLGARYLTAAAALQPDVPEAKEHRERRVSR